MMPKSDTIDAILKCNPTARPEFLSGFSNDELGRYLERLRDAARHRTFDAPTGLITLDDPPPADAPPARRAG